MLELPKTKYLGQLFGLSHTKSVGQLLGLPKNLDQNRWALDRTSHYQNSKTLGSCLKFPTAKTVGQLFELSNLQDQNRWAGVWTTQDQRCLALGWISQGSTLKPLKVFWTVQDSKTKPWAVFWSSNTKIDGQKFDFPKLQNQNRSAVVWTSQGSRPKLLSSWLNFPWLKTKTVGQLFELPTTKSVVQLFGLPKNLDHNRRALDRTSQSQIPKTLSSCLNFPWLKTKTVGQLFELTKTKTVGQLFEFSNTKTVCQLFELPHLQDQNRRAVVWTYLDEKCCAVVWTSQESRPQPLGTWSNFSIPDSKNVEQLFELPMTQDQNRRAVVWTY